MTEGKKNVLHTCIVYTLNLKVVVAITLISFKIFLSSRFLFVYMQSKTIFACPRRIPLHPLPMAIKITIKIFFAMNNSLKKNSVALNNNISRHTIIHLLHLHMLRVCIPIL